MHTDLTYITQNDVMCVLDLILNWSIITYSDYADELRNTRIKLNSGTRFGRKTCYIITSRYLWNIILGRTPRGNNTTKTPPIPYINLDLEATLRVMTDIKNYMACSKDNELINNATFEQASRLRPVFSEVDVLDRENSHQLHWKLAPKLDLKEVKNFFSVYNTSTPNFPDVEYYGDDLVVTFDEKTKDGLFAECMTRETEILGYTSQFWFSKAVYKKCNIECSNIYEVLN